MGPFPLGELVEGLRVTIGASASSTHLIAAVTSSVAAANAAALATGKRVIVRGGSAISDVVAVALVGQAAASAVLDLPLRRLVSGSTLYLIVAVTNGSGAVVAEVIVSAWGRRVSVAGGSVRVIEGAADVEPPPPPGPPPAFGGPLPPPPT